MPRPWLFLLSPRLRRREWRIVLLGMGALLLVSLAIGGVKPALLAQGDKPTTLIAYGDTRFTHPDNVEPSNPRARTLLVARIAEERPDAIVISGDVPWHGGDADDYARYRIETEAWRLAGLRVLPALGNHEFAECRAQQCLENWWAAFPELRGKRWYSADVGEHVRVIALDTMSALTAGSAQRTWLAHELTTLPPAVRFVIITLHHPPVADVQTRTLVSHNPRPNERALAAYLGGAARSSRARFVVVAGHIHNYGRFEQEGVVYLVSGGGGAVPYPVERTPADLYQGIEFPNYHYIRMTVTGTTLKGEMYRLDEPDAPMPHFTMKDAFEVAARGAEAGSSR